MNNNSYSIIMFSIPDDKDYSTILNLIYIQYTKRTPIVLIEIQYIYVNEY